MMIIYYRFPDSLHKSSRIGKLTFESCLRVPMIYLENTPKLNYVDVIPVCGRIVLHLGLLLGRDDVKPFVCLGEIFLDETYVKSW